MPENPLGGIGSRGDARSMKAASRAVRSYSAELRRLAGMEQKTGAAAEARAQAASRAIAAQNQAISKTSSLLDSQGKTLKNLDTVRERYHRKEMERAESLASRYEKVKEFLTDIREDSSDTSTVLGTFFRGWKKGVDNLVLRGRLPEASQQIKDLNFDITDLSGSFGRALDATTGFGKQLAEQAPLVWDYYQAAQKLDDEMVALATRYNITDEEARRLGDSIVKLTKVDIADGTKEVVRLADQLQYLQTTANLAADEGARYASERFQQMGTSFDEAGEELVQFTVHADLMREALKKTQFEGKAFSFAIREDFVRAMMEAHRQFTSQTADLENVAAAYQYAARKAVEYGISSRGATKFAQAFGKMLFKEDTSPETFLAGRRLSSQMTREIEQFKKEEGLKQGYTGMSAEQKKAVEERIARRMGIEGDLTTEMRTGIQESIMARGEGLGPSDIANMLSTTVGGIQARLEANKELFGNVGDVSALSRLLESRGVTGLDTAQKRRFARMIQTGQTEEVAKEIQKLQKQAEEKAADGLDQTKQALKAVLSLKDPVQELFNIKNLLKVLVLNVSTIGGMLEKIPGLGGMFSRVREYTESVLGEQGEAERSAAEKREKGLREQQAEIASRIKAAGEELREASSEEEKTRIRETITGLVNQNTEVATQMGEVSTTLSRLQQSEEATEGSEKRRGTEGGEETPGFFDRASGVLERGQDAYRLLQLTRGLPGVSFGGEGDGGILSAIPGVEAISRVRESLPGFLGGTEEEAGRQPQLSPSTAGQQARLASLGRSPRGAMNAAGDGDVTVGADGKAIMTVRMVIDNMEEVVAHAQSGRNQLGNAFLGGIG